MYTFYSQFSTWTDRKRVAKRAGCSKNPLFFALRISFIQWGINETITKLSWKFEENRTSGWFYFFKQKKEHKKWNPLYWRVNMLLHIRLRHWSNLSEFAFCIRLSALNHITNKFRTSQKCNRVKEAGTFFWVKASQHRTMFFLFSDFNTCPTKKPIRRNNAITASLCRVTFFRSSWTTQRRKGVFCRQTTELL